MPTVKSIIAFSVITTTLAAALPDTPKTPNLIKTTPSKVRQSTASDLKAYEKALGKVYDDYRQRLEETWSDPWLSSKTRWVSYSPDEKTRTIIDFANAKIILESVSPDRQKAYKDLQNALRRLLTIDTKRAYESDPLHIRLMRVKRPIVMVDSTIRPEPVLSSILFGSSDPKAKEVDDHIATLLTQQTVLAIDEKHDSRSNRYKVFIPLPSDLTQRLSKEYRDLVADVSAKEKLPAPLIFALIHAQSSYNPFATTYLTTYGVMGIRPVAIGQEGYFSLYGERRVPSDQYLYDRRANIELGAAYLHRLYYRDLKDIQDKNSRLYCTIAAYEHGVEALPYAFASKDDLTQTIAQIDSLESNEVFRRLVEGLREDTSRKLLLEVIRHMITYHKLYGEDGRE